VLKRLDPPDHLTLTTEEPRPDPPTGVFPFYYSASNFNSNSMKHTFPKIKTRQAGNLWLAAIPEAGIGVIGTTEDLATQAAVECLQTHNPQKPKP
jgi:hypothetical protein